MNIPSKFNGLRAFPSLLLVLCGMLAGQSAIADATATREYLCSNETEFSFSTGVYLSKEPCRNGKHMGDRITVSITPSSEDIGNPGAFFIGILKDGLPNGQFVGTAPWTDTSVLEGNTWSPVQRVGPAALAGTWSPIHDGLLDPAEHFRAVESSTKNYVVLDGQKICDSLGGGQAELWAGYGSLNAEEQKRIKDYLAVVSKGMTEEHLALVNIQHNMQRYKKAWKVFEISCPNNYSF